ncbi:MAG: DoxX family protein [Phycisphaerales bacterium]|nr:DoxX family protein [Phycisphaerales bacterium]
MPSSVLPSARDAVSQPDPQAVNAGALVWRLALGGVMVAHALAKPLVFTMPGTVKFFEAFGFPGWTVWPVLVVELLGGVMLIAGAWTRAAAVLLILVMLGALKVHGPNGWMFTSPNGGWEYIAVLIAGLAGLALMGPGGWSVDAKRRGRR